ncbi:probable inactive DNA (cytosine-5)-methyltransferase DRM3 [Aristolochia californica]|uniref:probable inactive DNA (cytosine-5)-methyltransferase DRM3 n=1 Tax=Aristolochia californica TaxID=171875 RepID=UPI0035E3685D
MGKILDFSNGDSSANLESGAQDISKVPAMGMELHTRPFYMKPKEESYASSSSSDLKSSFVSMGFSPGLVEKVIEENGDADADSILETLFTYSALEKSSISNSPDDQVSPKAEKSSSLEFSLGSSEEIEENDETAEVSSDRRRSLLKMDFSLEEINFAIGRLGEDVPIEDLLDFILAARTAGSFGGKDVDGSTNDSTNDKVITNETLFGTMDKTLRLLEMGFRETEISEAIGNFGAGVPILELADSIFANQIAERSVKEEKDDPSQIDGHRSENNSESTGSASREEIRFGETKPLSSYGIPCFKNSDCRSTEKGKRANVMSSDDNFGQKRGRLDSLDDKLSSFKKPKPEAGEMETETSSSKELHEWMETKPTVSVSATPPLSRYCVNSQRLDNRSPYFLYGNVADISKQTWAKISQFLYHIEPEFVNTHFFSAFIRNEGYIHDLPQENRFHILPRPAMTIEDTFPQTKKWWPSWDTRKQLSYIRSGNVEMDRICDRIRQILVDSQGVLSREQQVDILHQCKNNNLLWVGLYKVTPIEPDQVEKILGYPVGHTQSWASGSKERLRVLRNSFQTDTLGYHLSGLKRIFPDGLRLLSVFSGSGGAEVALHRLGIHLKVVVCVESSKLNREILRKWWNESRQTGELVMVEDVEALRVKMMDKFIARFGGFDLVIGGNPCTETDRESSAGMNFPLFFEFTRVLQRLKQRMRINR